MDVGAAFLPVVIGAKKADYGGNLKSSLFVIFEIFVTKLVLEEALGFDGIALNWGEVYHVVIMRKNSKFEFIDVDALHFGGAQFGGIFLFFILFQKM